MQPLAVEAAVTAAPSASTAMRKMRLWRPEAGQVRFAPIADIDHGLGVLLG
jgi:hypothetical protein